MGDFNWLTPNFLAFASPKSDLIDPIPKSSSDYAKLPKNIADITTSSLSGPFKNVLSHFVSRNIGLVVRLNSELYCPTYFEAVGIKHLDMIFEDGTCPALPIVKKFIDLAHEMINIKKKGIAVHCKAGLGRTGCLIGAYLIYRHGFTANEVIAFMRFMRPGMVVGPQQHWLHLNQGTFREWWWEDLNKEKTGGPSTPVKNLGVSKQRFDHSQTHTPPNGSSARRVLGEVDHNDGSAGQPAMDENLPAPTPGQPRKTSRAQHDRHHPYSRHTSSSFADDQNNKPDTEVVQIHRESRPSNGSDESEEEWNLKMLRRTASRSPRISDKKRAATYTTTTMTSYTQRTSHSTGTDSFSDVENHVSDDTPTSQRPKTPKTNSGNGANSLGVSKQRVSPRRSAESRGSVKDAGVRKASGRATSISNVKAQRVSN
jgi:cell division cycle 14